MFVWVEALHVPVNNFFSCVGKFSWVEPVLSNGYEVSCSRTQNHAPGDIQTRDLAIESPTLPTTVTVLSLLCTHNLLFSWRFDEFILESSPKTHLNQFTPQKYW